MVISGGMEAKNVTHVFGVIIRKLHWPFLAQRSSRYKESIKIQSTQMFSAIQYNSWFQPSHSLQVDGTIGVIFWLNILYVQSADRLFN